QRLALPGDIIGYHVDVAKPEDPIMHGIKSITYTSEQYYVHMDPAVEVLATTTFSGEHAPWAQGVVMPVVWKHIYGQGRVFHSTLGHRASGFEVKEGATIQARGINWEARADTEWGSDPLSKGGRGWGGTETSA